MKEQTKRHLMIVCLGLTMTAACTTNQRTAEPATAAAADAWLGSTSMDFSAPGFAPGARMAVLHGNPADTGSFVLRLSFPDGYVVPPHWHPTTEFVTVLRGTFVIGMGERADRSQARPIGVGGVAAAPARMPHFAWAQGATVVQVHGTGPFQLNLVALTP